MTARVTGRTISVADLDEDSKDPDDTTTIRRQAFRCDTGVRELCEANGLTEEAFVKGAHVLPSLDLLMGSLEDVRSLRQFKGLTALCLINVPSLSTVAGLDEYCHGLRTVNITECSLKTTRGLAGLIHLESLHLSSNLLETLQGMNGAISLKKLWANDNRIKGIQGLSRMVNLEELWLCRNHITEIGNSLPPGSTLRELNLAHNRLGCFKDLLKLASLEGLRSLTLQDPHFGDNPVCGLSNYKTYAAHHLTQLTSLDMELVSDESKTFANTVFLKKSMYYNMRSRIVKRHAGHLIRKAIELCSEKAGDLQTTLIHLQWQKKHVEQCRMAERGLQEVAQATENDISLAVIDSGEKYACNTSCQGGIGIVDGSVGLAAAKSLTEELASMAGLSCSLTGSTAEMLQLETKGRALAEAVAVVENALRKMEEQLSAFKQAIGCACRRAVSELMLEFDTGGNVRFEEGHPGDVWFSSCADLVKFRVLRRRRDSRSSVTRENVLPSVKVSRVVRIHNRFLKNQFERRVRESTAAAPVRSEIVKESPIVPSSIMAGSAVISDSMEERVAGPPPSAHDAGPRFQPVAPPMPNSPGRVDIHVARSVNQGAGEARWASSVEKEGDVWVKRGSSKQAGNKVSPATNESVSSRSGVTPRVGERDEQPIALRIHGSVGDRDTEDKNIIPNARGDGGGAGSSTRAARESKVGPVTEGEKGSKSSVPRARSLEYLFFTGIMTTSAKSVLFAKGETGDQTGFLDHERTAGGDVSYRVGKDHMDLLKLAEDGFRLSGRVEPEGDKIGKAQCETGALWHARTEASGVEDSVKERDHAQNHCARTVYLSSHLTEEDVPGMGREGSGLAAKETSPDDLELDLFGRACRVLVVKAYTGRCRHVTRSEAGSGRAISPGILREAWEAGYSSVCVTSPTDMDSRGDNGAGERNSTSGRACHQEWFLMDGRLALPEYIIEFDVSPELGKCGRAIKDGVRKRISKWKHELTPSSRSILGPSSSSSSSKDILGQSVVGSGRTASGTDVLPFLVPLARLARQLEIDAASYTRRFEAGISKALKMQPSAPALGKSRGSKGDLSKIGASVRAIGSHVESNHAHVAPVFSIPKGANSLLTRLSLHGQGVRKIEGLEAFPALEVLILSFNEISRLHGLSSLKRLRYLDLGYNIIEGVQHDDLSQTAAQVTASTAQPDSDMERIFPGPDSTPCSSISQEDGFQGASGTDEKTTRACDGPPAMNEETPETGGVALPSLTKLDLNNNILHDLDDLKALWELAPSLVQLDLRGNPLRSARTYRGAAIRGIPGLQVLDGRTVTGEETRKFHGCRSLTLDMVQRNGRKYASRNASHGIAIGAQRVDSGAEVDLVAPDGMQGGPLEHNKSGGKEGETCGEHVPSTVRECGNLKVIDERVDNYNKASAVKQHEESVTTTWANGEWEDEVVESEGVQSGKNRGQEQGEELLVRKPATATGMATSEAMGNTEGSTLISGRSSCEVKSPDLDERQTTGSDKQSEEGDVDDSGGESRPSSTSGLCLEDIELVSLNNLSLHKLEGIERLARLRVADLSGNELHDVMPLRCCRCLEELNLEGNELTTIGLRGLEGLRWLFKLDLGYNQISDLHPLCDLTGLRQLSLESNLLHNLRGLAKLVNLMELYCGNNYIATASEVDRLKHLPRLIIFDTTGNPMCSNSDFRMLVLFKMPKLKVLDGVGVGASEVTRAKFKFVGKLTEEVIRSRYDAHKMETLKYLDLSRSKWRSVEVLPTLPFRALQELNLDKNFLVDFAALAGLRSLGVLRLSHNRIEVIGEIECNAPEGATGSPCIFPQLEVLYLGFNRITDISALCLELIPRLLAVDLQGNNIVNLAGLNRCRTLVEVNLDGNKIRQLGPPSALNGLGSLRKLRLEDNGIRTLCPGIAASTPALLSLSLAQNRLTDPAELDRLGPLPNIVELSISGNPMARRPYSRLALLALFPSLVAVDATDITLEEKRLAETMSSGNSSVTVMTNPVASGSSGWTPSAPGLGTGQSTLGSSGSGTGPGVAAMIRGPSTVPGGRRDYFTVGAIGSVVRASSGVPQGNGMNGYPGGSSSHPFNPFQPQESFPPANGVAPVSTRSMPSGGISGSPSICGSMTSGEEGLAAALIARASPSCMTLPSNGEGGSEDDNIVGARHRVNPKRAQLTVTRRLIGGNMHSSLGGVKRPLKLTSINFLTVPVSDDERGGMGSRGGGRSTCIGFSRSGSSTGGSHIGSIGNNRGGFTGSSATAKPGGTLATLSGGGRMSPGSFARGKTASVPSGTGATGSMGRRY